MPLFNWSWQLVLLFAILSSNIRSTVSQGCVSLATNPNAEFSASSSVLGPGKPVVHGNDVWCAGIANKNQWLKVNLGSPLLFDQVYVQGLAGTNRSVAQYYLRTSNDDDVYVTITAAGGERPKAFYGPWFNGTTVVVQDLSTPVRAQYVIFNPREPSNIFENFMCMRIDILSCKNVPPAIDGEWTDWSNWSPCSPCGHSVKTRTRTCTDPAPAFGGSQCTGPSSMTQLCPTNNCKVDGNWSEWGLWSPCSETCGNGTEYRSRECNNPMPENNGADCVGPSMDSRNCFVRHCPVPGNWSSWGAWSPCSETCGNGTSTRTRACDNPAPAHGGAHCVGAGSMTKDCSEQPCPVTTPIPTATTSPPVVTTPFPTATASPPVVDGGWSDWIDSPCDAQCGPGKQNRTRTCNNPPPSGGGNDCLGSAVETVDCNNAPCVDPNMPNIDLAFAISATSANSNQSYDLMTNTIKQFIDEYGVDKIHYSLVVYGNSVVRVVNFNHTFPPSASDLKAAIDAQPPISGGPVLEDTLQEAFKVFNETEGRPDAKKVLVVMTDENSGADSNSLSTAVKPVEDLGVLVLSVGVGSAVDRSELSVISPNPLDVISPALGENPSVLADRIMERILRRTIPLIDVGFGIRASEINSSAIFTVMKETRDTINHRYGPGQVQYSIIIYGSKVATSFNFDLDSALDMNGLAAAVNQTLDVPGPIDLTQALTEAERLFQSHTTRRPFSERVFIAITDTAISDNDTELISAGDALRRQGILVFSVNNTGGGQNAVTITQIDFLGFPTFTTVRSVVIAETIIKKALEVNMPLIDLTFAISATSISADSTFMLMKTTINNIISQYDVFRIHYSVIVFGAVSTTPIDFGTNIPDKATLIRHVARLNKETGPVNLVSALEDAKRVYQLQEVRPDARRFLVVIMDNQSIDNVDDVNRAVTDLDNQDVVVIGVSIGNVTDSTDFEIITKDPRHIITAGVNKSPVELAKEIIDAIFISVRTAGFSQWGDWTACTKSCRSAGVAGTQMRTRVCVKSRLGCIGSVVETRECNTEDCQGCEERGPLPDEAYLASSEVQAASWARLNTSNPGASQRAWCAYPDDIASGAAYVQIDLGEVVDVFRIATKGQDFVGQESWVTSFFISNSLDGFSFSPFSEGGQPKEFDANTDPSSVVFNDVNVTTRYIRFHAINFTEQPCMQASVFGCTKPSGPTEGQFFNPGDKTEIGILIALWILAGILSFLLLMACCYYCCWHVCCGRGKKRKGLAAYRHTWIDETDGYLIEDLDKRWRLPAVDIVSSVQAVPEDEIQEVTVEMGNENPKPSGVIQFGIETEESQDSNVTADTVHSETPQYSEEVGPVKKGASMMTMSPADTGYRSAERRKRVKSETAASVLASGADSGARYVNSRRNSSGFTNGAFDRSQDWLIEPSDLPQNRNRAELKRSQSADEMATIDYGMFEQRPGSSQNAVRGELGRDGYMRMKQTSRERLDGANGGFPMRTADVAIGGIEPPNSLRGSSQLYGLQEQEITFTTDNGVCRREQWTAVGEEGPIQLREEGFREIHVAEESPYSEIRFDDEGNILSYKP